MPPNKLVWAATPNGTFTVKSAYWIAMEMKEAEQEGTSGNASQSRLWKTIWLAEVTNKIKNFVWRACQNILPTKSNLFHRHVLSSDVCDQCGQISETTSHVLLFCDFSRSAWESCNLLVNCHWNFADVVWRLGCDVGSSAISLAQFMAIAWNIWRNRNGIRHGEEQKKKENLILEASRLISEFQAVQDPLIPSVCRSQTSWLPPEPGFYKADVDGAVFKNLSNAGTGVLIRDYKGQVVAALSQRFFAPLGPLEVEAKAMEAAVIFARDVGIQNIIFEGDCLQVYNCLHGTSKAPPAVANVLNGISFHLQSFRSFDFSHIRRDGNKPAHILAQHAQFVSDFVAWVEETPSFLETVIASDVPDCL